MDGRRSSLMRLHNSPLGSLPPPRRKTGHCQRSIKARLRSPGVCVCVCWGEVCVQVRVFTCPLVIVQQWKIETPLLPEPLNQHNLQWFTIRATPSIHPCCHTHTVRETRRTVQLAIDVIKQRPRWNSCVTAPWTLPESRCLAGTLVAD